MRAPKPLAQHLRVVTEMQEHMGAREAASTRVREQRAREIERLTRDVGNVEAELAPLRAREAKLQKQIDAVKQELRSRESAQRKAESDLTAARASTEPAAASRIAACEAMRDAYAVEIQSWTAEITPLQGELEALRQAVTGHTERLNALQAEQRRTATALERDGERQKLFPRVCERPFVRRSARSRWLRCAASTARSLHREAPATAAEERTAKKREAEDLHRAAAEASTEWLTTGVHS